MPRSDRVLPTDYKTVEMLEGWQAHCVTQFSHYALYAWGKTRATALNNLRLKVRELEKRVALNRHSDSA